MINRFEKSEECQRIYKRALDAVREHGMLDMLKGGVVLGFSGGADSVMLLLVLSKIKRDILDFPLVAVHLNHCIRGDEAYRDEEFSKAFCQECNVPIITERIDVPSLAGELGIGVEEAARNARYNLFSSVINSSTEYSTVAVAHNATDNLETLVFNMMRGAGVWGMCGISPVRDNVIRPLIYSGKAEISSALDEAGIEYVTDSTNFDTDYKRNFIRHKILPLFSELTPCPENMGIRLAQNMREDKELIKKHTTAFLKEHYKDGKVMRKALLSLDKTEFFHVLSEILRQKSNYSVESVHTAAIFNLLCEPTFSYSLPKGWRFVSEGGYCYVTDGAAESEEFSVSLKLGVNEIPGYSTRVILAESDEDIKSYSNIFKILIKKRLPFDIIDGGITVRSRRDGDSYRLGGMTRRLKKLFNDKGIPPSRRRDVPVFEDKDGIIWVAGFGVREYDKSSKTVIVALAQPREDFKEAKSLYYGAED